jgi:hypothetical protein
MPFKNQPLPQEWKSFSLPVGNPRGGYARLAYHLGKYLPSEGPAIEIVLGGEIVGRGSYWHHQSNMPLPIAAEID